LRRDKVCAFTRDFYPNDEVGGVIEYNGDRYRVTVVGETVIEVEWIDEFREAVRSAVESVRRLC